MNVQVYKFVITIFYCRLHLIEHCTTEDILIFDGAITPLGFETKPFVEDPWQLHLIVT